VLIEGTDEVKLFGETITVKAKIMQLKGLSGHADQAGLIDWVSGFEKKPRRVFVVHGEDGVCTSFAGLLHHEHGFTTYAPYSLRSLICYMISFYMRHPRFRYKRKSFWYLLYTSA
jgi:metallo-beta-lactamase family protein